MRVHLELRADRAVTEHFDASFFVDEALRGERVGRDLALRRIVGERSDVHRDEALAEAVLEPAQLGDAHVQRRLPTFEPPGEARTGPRELTLGPASRGLALTL